MKLKKKGIAGHWKRARGHNVLLFMSSHSTGIIMQSGIFFWCPQGPKLGPFPNGI